MLKIKQMLRQATSQVSQTIDEPVKVAYALMRIAHLGRMKTADYDKNTINIAVAQHFRSAGLENPPDLPWGSIFINTVKRIAIEMKWDTKYEEQVMSAVFQDILLGQNLDSFDVDQDTGNLDFSKGQWSQGNLAQQIKDWREEGKDALDMEKLLRKQVNDKAHNKDRKFQQRQRGPMGDGGYHQVPFDTSDNFDSNPEGGDSNIVLNLLEMNPMTRSEASSWMSLSEGSAEIRDFLRKIDKYIQSRGDEKILRIWKAIKEEPDFKSRTDLARREITFFNRDKGRVQTLPLYEAIGVDSPRKVYYYIDKLQDLLKDLKPHAMELMAG